MVPKKGLNSWNIPSGSFDSIVYQNRSRRTSPAIQLHKMSRNSHSSVFDTRVTNFRVRGRAQRNVYHSKNASKNDIPLFGHGSISTNRLLRLCHFWVVLFWRLNLGIIYRKSGNIWNSLLLPDEFQWFWVFNNNAFSHDAGQ